MVRTSRWSAFDPVAALVFGWHGGDGKFRFVWGAAVQHARPGCVPVGCPRAFRRSQFLDGVALICNLLSPALSSGGGEGERPEQRSMARCRPL